jgi:hypothetical protein
MVTLIVVALLLGFLFFYLYDDGAFVLLGLLCGCFVGGLLAGYIGSTYPTATTTTLENIQVLNVGADVSGKYVVEKNEASDQYIYQVDDVIKTVSINNSVNVSYTPDGVKPYVEYSKTVLALPEGQGWKRAFCLTDYPRNHTTIHIPQGTMFVVEK